jgi:hypothetical protein
MSQQLTLGFDAEVTLQTDGSYRVLPGKLVAKAAEDWRPLIDVISQMPYKAPWRNRALLISGEINGRQRKARGHWEVEMNSLRAYLKALETQK